MLALTTSLVQSLASRFGSCVVVRISAGECCRVRCFVFYLPASAKTSRSEALRGRRIHRVQARTRRQVGGE
eukprot:4871953-Lingulodinium_polyedra.AAC.1